MFVTIGMLDEFYRPLVSVIFQSIAYDVKHSICNANHLYNINIRES
jgi:hypothetical protein